jgi:flagellin
MSIFTSAVNGSLHDISGADQATAKLSRELTTGRKIDTPEDGPSAWLEASRARSTASYLDAVHTGLNEVGTNIQVVDTTMQAIGQNLKTMQGLLDTAGNYPTGDQNRQHLISSFNTVRQQIDQIVNTTAEPAARNLMSDPAVNPQAGDIQVLVGLNGGLRTVHRQQVDTGANGLNIPALDAAASNDALQAALAGVQTAQSTLAVRRQALAVDAEGVTRYLSQAAEASSFYQSQAESLTIADSTEAAAELQSVSVQRSLAVDTLSGISTIRGAVLDLLR